MDGKTGGKTDGHVGRRATARVAARGIRSRPTRMSRANFVSSIPTRSIIAPMIAVGKTEKRPAMAAAKKRPSEISIAPSIRLVPPVRAPK